jgi:lysophospholipase L1-like esterase
VATLRYLLFLLVATAAILLGLEGAGRLYVHYKFGVPGKSYGLWQGDPVLGATHSINGYNTQTQTNNYGFRGAEDVIEPKPSNGIRVLALGGSTTFGYNLKDGETWPEHLQAKLRAVPGLEQSQVLNGGKIMFGAGHNLIELERWLPKLKPDYVVIYEGINEVTNAVMLQLEGRPLDGSLPFGSFAMNYDQNRFMKRNSVIVRWLDYAALPGIGHAEQPKAAVNPVPAPKGQMPAGAEVIHQPWVQQNFAAVLTKMITASRAHGAEPIVLHYPSVGWAGYQEIAGWAEQTARAQNVAVVDLEAHFNSFGERKPDYFIETGVHVTAAGAEEFAKQIAAQLLAIRQGGATPATPTTPASPTETLEVEPELEPQS